MRIGVVWESMNNAHYRAIDPMLAMARRGHEVVWPENRQGEADLHRLSRCDVIHVYRRCDDSTCRVLAELVSAGRSITWDNDDDFTAVPKESPTYSKMGGLRGRQVFSKSVRVAKMAHTVTSPTEALAEIYRRAGARRVEVIGNHLNPDVFRARRRHDGVVIGWIAGIEHQVDAARIPIAAALRQIAATHDNVTVECIGVDLRLPERYRFDARVDFRDLPPRLRGLDIGIAPLTDIPFNRARSDIKLKEYAASGVAWLASPVGPYLGLGEEQGGRLVRDDEWSQALERLVTRRRERRKLGKKGLSWAKRQTIEAVADRWEQVLTAAAREPKSFSVLPSG